MGIGLMGRDHCLPELVYIMGQSLLMRQCTLGAWASFSGPECMGLSPLMKWAGTYTHQGSSSLLGRSWIRLGLDGQEAL